MSLYTHIRRERLNGLSLDFVCTFIPSEAVRARTLPLVTVDNATVMEAKTRDILRLQSLMMKMVYF